MRFTVKATLACLTGNYMHLPIKGERITQKERAKKMNHLGRKL